jgi:hypothetical protein
MTEQASREQNPANPFTPGFGRSPAVLAGRNPHLRTFRRALAGDAEARSILISGARGVGKTVLLNEFEAVAEETGWILITLHTASASLTDELREAAVAHLRRLDGSASSSRLTGAGFSGASLQREVNDRYGQEREPLSTLLDRLAGLAAETKSGLMITMDEVQSADHGQLQEVTQHVQDLIRREHEAVFVAAGVRSGVNTLLSHDKTTFLRRAHRMELEGVDVGTAAEAVRVTVADTHRTITPEAAVRAGELSHGYPYLIQLVGARAWQASGTAQSIETADVDGVRADVIDAMVRNVHGPALRETSPRKMDYLLAMLEDAGASRTADIGRRISADANIQSTLRTRLIHDELIRPAGYGAVEFALPYLREALQAGPGEAPGLQTDTGLTRSIRRTRRSS